MKLTILLLFSLFFTRSFSQNNLADTFFVKNDIDNIVPGQRKYIQYTETKEGFINFQSILTRKIEKAIYEGKQQWLITQTYQQAKSIDTDSSYCDIKTLMPSTYFTNIQSEGHREKVIFSDKQIINTIFFKDSISSAVKDNKYFYNGVIADDIIATMPLQQGARFIIKTLNPGKRYFEYYTTVEVLGKEEIEVPGLGIISCWKINTSQGGGIPSTEWYAVKGQFMVKKKFVFKNGNIFYRMLLVG